GPAPDGGDRPVAARRPEGHHPGRADGRAGRRPDRRGAQPGGAAARERPGRDHDQPHHGRREGRGRQGRGAQAGPQQRLLRRRRRLHRRHHRRDHRRHRQRGGPAGGPASGGAPVMNTTLATDRQDERLQRREGLRGALGEVVERARGGDLGVIPVVVGLIVIWSVLQALNPIFLSSQNLVNLTMESAAVGIIALGIVCVLLVGQIDLSVGSVSGLSGAVLAVLFVDQGLPVWVAISAAVILGAVIGWVYAQLYNRFGVPSFVITLAG